MTDRADLIKRLRSGVIEWCRVTHQGHVTDNTPYEAADALEANIKWQQRMVAIMAAGGKLDAYREMAKKLADAEAEIERLKNERTAWRDRYSDLDYPARRVFFENAKPEIARLKAEINRLKKQADCGHSDLPQECHSCGWRVRLGEYPPDK